MTRTASRSLLGVIAMLSAIALSMVITDRDLLLDPKRPEDPTQWIADHPADWLALSIVADRALDSSSPRRLELWRQSHARAMHLAPRRPVVNSAFVRGGLFHWYELEAADRARVLKAAEPLMRDPPFFARMYAPIWRLTRDFTWLRRNVPPGRDSLQYLQGLAVSQGLFGEYRALREELRAERMRSFEKQRDGDPASLLALLPQDITSDDDALVRGILTELDRQAFDPDTFGPQIDALLDYAVRHDVGPLSGLVPLLQLPSKHLREVTRARAALDLNDADLAMRIEVSSALPGNKEWDAYFLDRARFEARKRNAPVARAYLIRTSDDGSTAALAAAEDVARLTDNTVEAARLHQQLADRSNAPRTWSGTCGPDELCTVATTTQYASGAPIRLSLVTVQSDEIAPYVEVFVDDTRVAEGEVREGRVFEIRAPDGLRQLRVRLVNPRTRNNIQRRVRLS